MAAINGIGRIMLAVAAFVLSAEFNCAKEAKMLQPATATACKPQQKQQQQHKQQQQKQHNTTNPIVMWGDVDPNVFHICDPATNIPRQMRCPEGRGFFNGLGYYGCIPFEDWPACIPDSVRRHKDNTGNSSSNNNNDIPSVLCDSEHLLEPWESSDPNKFYMCADAAIEPILVNCEIGKGFVTVASSGKNGSNSKIVGCTAWDKWRAYMQCEQYY